LVDGEGAAVKKAVAVALDQLAGRDRVAVVDVSGARVILPPMPASNRSMAMAAVETHLRTRAGVAPRDVPRAFAAAARAVETSRVTQRVLVLADHPLGPDEITEV